MRLKLWGVRGSTPTPQIDHLGHGGNTSCVEIRLNCSNVLVFDGGSGIRNLGQALSEEFQCRSLSVHVFLSHFHWDHIQGIPFFLPLYEPDRELTFYASDRIGPLRGRLEGQMTKPYFPVSLQSGTRHEFVEIGSEVVRIGEAVVYTFPLNHPQGACGYRIETPGCVVAYATDLEHGDRALDTVLLECVRGADFLIYDAQYTPDEYPAHKGWGHSTWLEGVRVARQAKVKNLVLFHHDPWHDDRTLAGIVASAREQFENTTAAVEGWCVER